jgi:hypothetical protein
MKIHRARILARCTAALVWSAVSLAAPRTTYGQNANVTMLDFSTGSEFEEYVRALQVAGGAPLYPWSVRGFSHREVRNLVARDTAGPWRLQSRYARARLTAGPLSLSAIFNSGFPYGSNDGAIWAGKGWTYAVSGGIAGHLGPVSMSVAPLAFRAENRSFDLLANGKPGLQVFNHGTLSDEIDYPQRFGAEPYSRIDDASSGVRIDTRALTIGLSTANEWIGPATEYPFLLGTNAPGFPHLFIGSGDPWNLWIAKIHARVSWGKLYQSDYSPVSGSTHFIAFPVTGSVRLTTAASVVLLPRGAPGLEIGAARFFHVPYRDGEPSSDFWKKPVRLFFLKNEFAEGDLKGSDNQLASVFFRWVLPNSGFEVYGERGYEDQFYDLREFLQDLDHLREYMLGFQKILGTTPGKLNVLRVETVNYQRSTLARVRVEGAIYGHSTLRQGHTNRGQLLGASPGAGSAAATTLSWTRYSAAGRTSISARRLVHNQRGDFQVSGVVDPKNNDAIAALGIERMRFGRYVDVGAKLELMKNYNRNFSRDVTNVNVQLSTRFHP